MLQANAAIFSISPIYIVGYYGLNTACNKVFAFLKTSKFFAFLTLIGTRMTLILYDFSGFK
jgi:hypothetical protein